MNTKDLARMVAEDTGMTIASAEDVVECVFKYIVDAVDAGDTVKISQFGTFKRVERNARRWYS